MIDAAIQIICNLLDSPPWEIGIMATSKGLVSGQLVIKIDNEHVIDCSLPTGLYENLIYCGIFFMIC